MKVLRGFEKVFLQKGEKEEVVFELLRRDLSVWSVEEQAWVLKKGRYGLMVGASSSDLRLKGEVLVGGDGEDVEVFVGEQVRVGKGNGKGNGNTEGQEVLSWDEL